MDSYKKEILKKRVEKTAENLRRNNFEVYCVEKKEEVVPLIEKLVPAKAKVSNGGSMSLTACGVMEHLASGRYDYINRDAAGLAPEERAEKMREALLCDCFFSSSNAVTENGELYNVDGNGNRVAALLFGPRSVIVVVGSEKIVPNIEAASERVKKIAAPANSVRLNCTTYCHEKGECAAFQAGNPEICSGCAGDSRICCDYVIMAHQRMKNRVKVILVEEEIGY